MEQQHITEAVKARYGKAAQGVREGGSAAACCGDACGCGSIPTLNQTGLLKAAFCWTSRWVSSSEKFFRSSGVAK